MHEEPEIKMENGNSFLTRKYESEFADAELYRLGRPCWIISKVLTRYSLIQAFKVIMSRHWAMYAADCIIK